MYLTMFEFELCMPNKHMHVRCKCTYIKSKAFGLFNKAFYETLMKFKIFYVDVESN